MNGINIYYSEYVFGKLMIRKPQRRKFYSELSIMMVLNKKTNLCVETFHWGGYRMNFKVIISRFFFQNNDVEKFRVHYEKDESRTTSKIISSLEFSFK